ncbi:MAG: Holliday junction branch migration protein RuvA, partial [Clostridia bacterium]|nr:Holliday junction branch migration protein RuvA [Clostridia bacterium]
FMIGYVKGKLLHENGGEIILENNGVGFSITPSAEAYKEILANGGGAVYTYMAVREDDISLYGFKSIEEKNMFLKLITVSGIGPKMGMTVLSNMSLTDLAVKIATSDVKGLSQVKGLGKKKAEFIIVELREKMSEELKDKEVKKGEKPMVELVGKDIEDAMLALTGLGFSKQECVAVLSKAKAENVEGVQALITYSLKNIK